MVAENAIKHQTKVAFAGDDIHCRREVFDALTAAGGSLSVDELRESVRPHLIGRVGGEIRLAGGFEEYFSKKINSFRRDMVTVSRGTVALRSGYVLMVPSSHHAGGQVSYVPGTQRHIDYASKVDAKIIDLRDRGIWDCLLPISSGPACVEAVRTSLQAFGWDASRPLMLDSMRVVIDGRMRLTEHRALNPQMFDTPKKEANWLAINAHAYKHSLRPVQGIVRSFYENRCRCTDEEIISYKEQLADHGIEWERLLRSVKMLTARTGEVLRDPPIETVLLGGSNLLVTTDGQWVQLRTLVLSVRLQPHHATKGLAPRLKEYGFPVMHRLTPHSPAQASHFAEVSSLISIIEGHEVLKPEMIWPSRPEYVDRLVSSLPALKAIPRELRKVQAAKVEALETTAS
jgi:hypothetical protein